MGSSTGQPSWKSPFMNQQTLETKTFTWRLRPHLTTATPSIDVNTTRSTKSFSSSTTGGSSRPSTSSVANASSSLVHSANQEQHDSFLRFQEFEIECGQSLEMHCMWTLYIVSCGSNHNSNTNITSSSTSNSDFVGLFLQKILKSGRQDQPDYLLSVINDDEIAVRYKIEIMDREGEVLYTKDCETTARDKLEVGYWDWRKIVPVAKFHCCGKSQPKDASHSADECLLLMRVSFTMINRRKDIGKSRLPVTVGSPEEEETNRMEAANAFVNLVTNSNSLQPDVIIELTNRKRFLVHKKILTGRSPVFLKMLSANMNEKARGVVKVEDISANTMELVLKFIYTGQLEEEWTTNPVTVTELIYASEKYWLPALKEFCNKHLVRAATKTNCYKLMEVAQLHNLEQATDDLMAFASEGISSSSSSRKPSEESVELSDKLL
ncbi:TD and POZ domain-containing protein 4 [Orchesella cincta]|uniref:TD and POZ domain-containing protein 4 n=1 Tax=Orchesella cincta TaxID=48709 RepID=A0A1D2MFW8_ORCCI|nr:TD and POZ domain-containing protein 4 [Orchesella cincta]